MVGVDTVHCVDPVFYELLFHGMNFSLDDGNIAAIIAFVVVVGGVFSVLTGFFPPVIQSDTCNAVHVVYGCDLHRPVRISFGLQQLSVCYSKLIKFGNQAVDNADTVIYPILKARIVDVILLAVPVLIMIVCIWTFMAFDRRRWWVNLIGAAGTASGVRHNTVCDVGCGLGCVQSELQFIPRNIHRLISLLKSSASWRVLWWMSERVSQASAQHRAG